MSLNRSRSTEQQRRAIVAMATALGLEVVAEGVETAEQAAEAQSLGCDWAQGYYFARPTPPAEIEALIAPVTAGALDAP